MPAQATWDGTVLEVWPDGDTFTAELRRGSAPGLVAEFSMRECGVKVQAGDSLVVTKNHVGKRDLGYWTQEEIDDIMERATTRLQQLRRLCD